MMGRIHPRRMLRSLWAESPSYSKCGLGGVWAPGKNAPLAPWTSPKTEPSRVSEPKTRAQVVQV